MKIYENGVIREMTAEEIAEVEEAAARAEAEEKHRPYTIGEVSEMLIRQQINTLTVEDAVAIRMKDFYPAWESGKAYTTANGCPVGHKVTRNGRLWKLRQEHTSQDNWAPGETGTESLWEEICETHDGTKYDPIPYNGNMALENGKYYTQGGVLYRCTRDTGNPVYHALSELVGIYVEVAA
jgi:hypothetical protein